jgi:hypothetical protein
VTAALIGALALGLFLVAVDVAGTPAIDLLGDPNQVSESSWWLGAVSLLGLLLWAGAAAMLLITGLVLRERGDSEDALFFLVTAALVAGLGVDDALVVHEVVLPDELGIPQPLVLLAYGGIALAWLIRFREHLTRELGLLALAAAGFAASVVFDNLHRLPGVSQAEWIDVADEYTKYAGLCFLFAWALTEARRELLGRTLQG